MPMSRPRVAPNVRANLASTASSGLRQNSAAAETAATLPGCTAVIAKLRRKVDHGHQRGSPDRRTAAHHQGVRDEHDEIIAAARTAGPQRRSFSSITHRPARIAMFPPEIAMT